MARSIDTIFNQMVAQKQSTPALSSLTSSSSTAIWRLLLYVVAFCINVHERLWDTYRTEVNAAIEQMLPHRPKWYRDKALAFMRDKTLVPDTDRYDTTGMSDEDIAAAQVVKHATANENEQSSLLIIKVAGEDSATGKRTPITSAEQTQLTAYLQAVKEPVSVSHWSISLPTVSAVLWIFTTTRPKTPPPCSMTAKTPYATMWRICLSTASIQIWLSSMPCKPSMVSVLPNFNPRKVLRPLHLPLPQSMPM